MSIDLGLKDKIPEIAGENIDFAAEFFKGWNKIAAQRGEYHRKFKEIDLDAFQKEYADIKKSTAFKQTMQKATSGAGASTGSGLIHEDFVPFTVDMVANERGGGFRASGVDRRTNSRTVNFTSSGAFGDFVPATSGSSTTNEISPTYELLKLAPEPYIAEIQIFDDPVLANYNPSPAQLLSVFRVMLEIKKEENEDLIASDAVVNNASYPNIEALPPSPLSDLQLAERVIKLVTQFRKFGRPAIYMNENAFYSFVTQQGGDKHFVVDNKNYNFTMFEIQGEVVEVGRVATFAGCPVFKVPKIRNTYTVNASNRITATTGGSNTAIFVGIPRHMGIIRGYNSMDSVVAFDRTRELSSFRRAETVIGATTYMNAGIINQKTWGYYSFTV